MTAMNLTVLVYPCPNYFPSQFDHALRKDVSLYTLSENSYFCSLDGSVVEIKWEERKMLEFIFKIITKIYKNSEYTEIWASFSRDHEHPMNGMICFDWKLYPLL